MRSLATSLLALVVLCAPAWAERVFGHVYLNIEGIDPIDVIGFGPGDIPQDFAVITIRSLGGEFEMTQLTDPFGAYEFDVPAGLTYEFVLPLLEAGPTTYLRVEQPPAGPPMLLDLGVLTVMPGEETEVDLPLAGAVGPVFAFESPANVVFGGITSNPEIEARPPNLSGCFSRFPGGGSGDTDFVNYLSGVLVQMVHLDEHGDPIGLPVATTTEDGIFKFVDNPLQHGDTVRVFVDPTQPALDGFAPVYPTSVEFTYDALNGSPGIEFRFNPVKDITGRAFLRVHGCRRTYDIGLRYRRVQLLDFTAEEPTVIAETRTDCRGNFRFEDVFHGVYTVRLLGWRSRVLAEDVRLVYGEIDPAPIEFKFEWGGS